MLLKIETSFQVCGQAVPIASYHDELRYPETYPEINIEKIYEEHQTRLLAVLKSLKGFSEKRDDAIDHEIQRLLEWDSVADGIKTGPMTITRTDVHDAEYEERDEQARDFLKDYVAAVFDESLKEDRFGPKPLTQEALRRNLLAHVKGLCDYWNTQPGGRITALTGLAFSIFASIDGTSMGLPGFNLTALRPPEQDFNDIEYSRTYGSHWTYPFGQLDIAGSLHDLFVVAEKDEFDGGPYDHINILRAILGQDPLEWTEGTTREEVDKIRKSTVLAHDNYQARMQQIIDADRVSGKLPKLEDLPSHGDDEKSHVTLTSGDFTVEFNTHPDGSITDVEFTPAAASIEDNLRAHFPATHKAVQAIEEALKEQMNKDTPPWEDLPFQAGKNHDPVSSEGKHPRTPGHFIRKEEPKK